MKISKDDLLSLIHEAVDEMSIHEAVTEDKYDKAIKVIDAKILNLNIQVAKLKLDKAKIRLDKSLEGRRQAQEAADAGERSGSDTTESDTRLETAIEAEAKARDGVSAANNNLKSVQKGGSSN
jgi:ABC-type phosphate transport system auxiliary subunit